MVRVNGQTPRPNRRKSSSSSLTLSFKLLGSFFACLLVAWVVLSFSVLSPGSDRRYGVSRLGRSASVLPSSAIAYVVSVTGCGTESLVDGAAVLRHSIHLSSVHGAGRYDYQMYAIVHPEAMSCGAPLAEVGYTLLERPTPVALEDIRGDFLRGRIQKNGCCGEKELIKLEAYTLVQHRIVVHLDLDTLVMKPLDNIFDLMMGKGSPDSVDIMWKEQPLPSRIDAFFTRDYNMVPPSRKYKPVQGGFVVLRPNMDVYHEFVEIVKEGNFIEGEGWGGVMGLFYGCMTFQGLLPYYYDVIKPGHAVELNRCIYNNMCDNPRDKRTVNDVVDGKCRDGRDDCEDCRSQPVEDIVTTHFTLCQKPWLCTPHDVDALQHRLCRKLHHEWFRIRSSLEESWGQGAYGPGNYQREEFYGFCTKRSENGYVPVDLPKGLHQSSKQLS